MAVLVRVTVNMDGTNASNAMDKRNISPVQFGLLILVRWNFEGHHGLDYRSTCSIISFSNPDPVLMIVSFLRVLLKFSYFGFLEYYSQFFSLADLNI